MKWNEYLIQKMDEIASGDDSRKIEEITLFHRVVTLEKNRLRINRSLESLKEGKKDDNLG